MTDLAGPIVVTATSGVETASVTVQSSASSVVPSLDLGLRAAAPAFSLIQPTLSLTAYARAGAAVLDIGGKITPLDLGVHGGAPTFRLQQAIPALSLTLRTMPPTHYDGSGHFRTAFGVPVAVRWYDGTRWLDVSTAVLG